MSSVQAAVETFVTRRSSQQSRRFAMTFNNYNEDQHLLLQTRGSEIFKYLIIGREVGETLTPHLQMYGELTNKLTVVGLKKKLVNLDPSFGRVHIETSVSDAAHNIAYCSKENNFIEIGSRPLGQGKRSDIDAVVQRVSSGESMSSIIENHGASYIKYYNGIHNIYSHYQKPRDFMTIGYWLSGETGSGKSRWALEKFPDAFWKAPDTKWFDGYLGEETIVFDDFRPTKEMSFQTILRMVDRYPMKVEVKGNYVNFRPKRIIFTSPKKIQETFQHLEWLGDEAIQQLNRRIPYQLNFSQDNYPILRLLNPENSLTEATEIPISQTPSG